jgi:hypothetical protein
MLPDRETGMRALLISFAVVALVGLTCAVGTPASGATLTCELTLDLTDARWADYFAPLRIHGIPRPDHPVCQNAKLTGEIGAGDARAVEAMVQTDLPFVQNLALNSNGGSVDEAIRIGRVARRYFLRTCAPYSPPLDPPGAICASACFFAWLGGVSRMGERIGLHRPFPSVTEMRKMSPVEADQLYHDLSAKILAYLSEMGAAPHWLIDMIRIPSNDLYVIPYEQLKTELEGGGEHHLIPDIPSISQWKFSRCSGLSAKEWDELQGLWSSDKLSKTMHQRLNYLGTKSANIDWCGDLAVMEARWLLRNANPKTDR